MAFSITGQIKVATLKQRFLKEFGLTLRVYDGRSFADEGQTISQIRKKKGSGDLSVRKSMKVGTLEEKLKVSLVLKFKLQVLTIAIYVKTSQHWRKPRKRIRKE